jgi:hypothetical protein
MRAPRVKKTTAESMACPLGKLALTTGTRLKMASGRARPNQVLKSWLSSKPPPAASSSVADSRKRRRLRKNPAAARTISPRSVNDPSEVTSVAAVCSHAGPTGLERSPA